MIYLLRHGDAEAGDGDDAARRLTKKGERQAEAAGRAIAALGIELDACLTSPRVRALDTAVLACEHLSVDVEVADALEGGHFDAEELAAGRGEVLLVGHEPDFSHAVSEMTGGRIKLKKGGVAAVEGGTLHALWRPAGLRRLAGI